VPSETQMLLAWAVAVSVAEALASDVRQRMRGGGSISTSFSRSALFRSRLAA